MARIIQPAQIPPGFDKRSTDVDAEGRWVDGDKVRSSGGVIETMRGWRLLDESNTLDGTCRGIAVWRSLDNKKNIVFGTTVRLFWWQDGTLTNITPIRDSGTLGTDPFAVTSGSTRVVVTHTSHGVIVGDYVTFSGATAGGGITIDGEYNVTEVINSNSYEIEHGSAATSTDATTGGASVTYSYEINIGEENTVDAFGFGVGPFGEGTFGTARETSTILLRARTWTVDTSGEDVIACPRGGNIYLYDYSAGGNAATLANAPTINKAVFVAAERHVVALGSGSNPMQIAWSDQDDITQWSAAADNQAGSITLRGGSEIITGLKLRGGINAIWTDTDLFRMVYLGQEPFWSFQRESGGVGAWGPHAVTQIDGIAYWMADGNIYSYDGVVRELPNQDDVRSYVFSDSEFGVDPDQSDKIFAFVNVAFREVWWLYQSISSTDDIDRYVMFNLDERTWYTGSFERTAWHDSRLLDHPVATDTSGNIYEQEVGTDDGSAAIRKVIRSSFFDLGDGLQSMDVFGFIPDFANHVGTINLTIYTRDRPTDSDVQEGPYPITPQTEIVDLRANGRHVAFQLESDEVGGKFGIGSIRFELQPSGTRR